MGGFLGLLCELGLHSLTEQEYSSLYFVFRGGGEGDNGTGRDDDDRHNLATVVSFRP